VAIYPSDIGFLKVARALKLVRFGGRHGLAATGALDLATPQILPQGGGEAVLAPDFIHGAGSSLMRARRLLRRCHGRIF
jgi:hypothetical protein